MRTGWSLTEWKLPQRLQIQSRNQRLYSIGHWVRLDLMLRTVMTTPARAATLPTRTTEFERRANVKNVAMTHHRER